MSKPSWFYEPKGTNFRPASPGTLLAFYVGRFVGKVLAALRDGIRGGHKSR